MNTSSSRKIWGALLLFIAGSALVAALALAVFAFSPLKPQASETLIVEIQKGDLPAKITRTLTDQKVIDDPRLFLWLGKLTRSWPGVKAGEYQVSPTMTPFELFRTLRSGRSVNYPFTVLEGENMYEVGAKLESKGIGTRGQFVSLCRDPAFIARLGFTQPLPASLEGYLFPDTYFIQRSPTLEQMAEMMVRRFFTVWKQFDGQEKNIGMSRHEVITLASIIEKETGAPEERPLISSVFHNRLRKHMRLQSDPTTIYGMWERYKGNIQKRDLSMPSPFNTYTIAALPVGPISNPGREAIAAALNPANDDALFFVSKNDGTHEFNVTYEGHSQAVHRLQKDPKAREGKSWRDLKTNRASNE